MTAGASTEDIVTLQRRAAPSPTAATVARRRQAPLDPSRLDRVLLDPLIGPVILFGAAVRDVPGGVRLGAAPIGWIGPASRGSGGSPRRCPRASCAR